MKINRLPAGYTLSVVALALLVTSLAIMPNRAHAQAVGNKTVYNSTPRPAPSQVWIDASAFCPTTGCTDFCTTLNKALQKVPSQGAVVDARGVFALNGGTISCSINPWQNPPSGGWPPSTVLLPAAQINIATTWVLPNNTKISGENPRTVVDPNAPSTVLVASGSFKGTDLIEMGSASPGFCPAAAACSGVAVEHLKLDDGSSGSHNGIVNSFSQSQSYVNDVGLGEIGMTGLVINGPSTGIPGAANSGPYSNIEFTPGTNPSTTMQCVDIDVQTRGLHGITCNGGQNSHAPGQVGIVVNASNNTIENVFMQAFWDGIEVGNTGPVGNIVISNVQSGAGIYGGVTNTVHICGSNPNQSGTFGACATFADVTDVTVLGATNGSGGKSTSIDDDVTGTSITATLALPTAGMYVLGGSVAGGGYSRFATNPSVKNTTTGSTVVPTWGVGTTAPTIGGSCNTPGALYSNTQGASGSAVFVCTGSPSNYLWQIL